MARSKNIYTIYTYICIYNAIWVPSQHSLPLQELSLRQMGHREWCPPLQLQQPAMLFQLTGHIKRNDLGTCTHLSIIPGPSWLFSSFVLANLAVEPFPDLSGGNMAVTVGKCPVHSIAWLQRKLSYHSVSLESFKSSKVKNGQVLLIFPFHNPPKYDKICLDTSVNWKQTEIGTPVPLPTGIPANKAHGLFHSIATWI